MTTQIVIPFENDQQIHSVLVPWLVDNIGGPSDQHIIGGQKGPGWHIYYDFFPLRTIAVFDRKSDATLFALRWS